MAWHIHTWHIRVFDLNLSIISNYGDDIFGAGVRGTLLFTIQYESYDVMYNLKHALGSSALSDIKCEAVAERFISDKARLQVL